jgi:hypothetical protein
MATPPAINTRDNGSFPEAALVFDMLFLPFKFCDTEFAERRNMCSPIYLSYYVLFDQSVIVATNKAAPRDGRSTVAPCLLASQFERSGKELLVKPKPSLAQCQQKVGGGWNESSGGV